jgi:hypothetical protein
MKTPVWTPLRAAVETCPLRLPRNVFTANREFVPRHGRGTEYPVEHRDDQSFISSRPMLGHQIHDRPHGIVTRDHLRQVIHTPDLRIVMDAGDVRRQLARESGIVRSHSLGGRIHYRRRNGRNRMKELPMSFLVLTGTALRARARRLGVRSESASFSGSGVCSRAAVPIHLIQSASLMQLSEWVESARVT